VKADKDRATEGLVYRPIGKALRRERGRKEAHAGTRDRVAIPGHAHRPSIHTTPLCLHRPHPFTLPPLPPFATRE
jgi:hypothetical protein